MSPDLVSVVIPCFNAEAFLAATVESVRRQTGADWEIVLVDDGSTDGTADVIRGIASDALDRVTAVFGENRGAGPARETGTARSSGAFVLYLDADDVLCDATIARRVRALRDSGAGVAYCDWRRCEETDDGGLSQGELVDRRMEEVDADPEIATFTTFWAPPGALLYRREVVDRIGGFRPTLPVIQDARYLFDAAFVGASFVHVPEVGLDYRVRKGSLSRGSREDFARDVLVNADEVEALWRARGPLTAARREALLSVFGYVARSTFELDRELFDAVCDRLFRLDPAYVPSEPRHLALVSRLVGYRRAERIAGVYRRAKRWIPGRR